MNLKLIATTALIAVAGTSAFAEPAAGEFNKEKTCGARREANTIGLDAIRKARPNEAAMRTQLTILAKDGVGNGICLADLLGKNDDDIVALLTSIASTDSDIEPAAGDEDNTTPAEDFGAGDGEVGGENPSQLNETVTTPGASPVVTTGPLPEGEIFVKTTNE